MKIKGLDLSITEQFIILQLTGNKFIKNKKVKIGDSKIYVLASILVDLSLNDKISFDGNQEITIKDAGLTGIEYNDIVLNLIKSKGVISLKKCTQYFYLHSKLLKNIYNSIIESVIKKGALEVKKIDSFFSTSKKAYVDSKKVGDLLIQKLRIDLLENGNMDMDTMYLAILLDSNKTLMSYFSEYEYSIINDKMKTIYQKDESNKFKIMKKSINNIEAISILNLVIDIISSFI
ncbi:hypothetical protein K8O96_09105 [Clostridium sporogenes]|uniref:GPP34 family phosphoprotein n=1 Tax=Clostridium botulinum TaxID=1491 RepID=A0A6M0SYX4_CLOBO|nr:hypothetical protein [Clostridium sporogenes]NFA60707.1 hypothetical protein [Clostridium botulinum]NFI74157.1 hypothetical protein [Clostridium sporogenes]NFL71871.1 hypothetical protein [Clostridium sporogenes]NFM23949.1 hypothetical protein [Clostridium sporogenes]NFP62031.1 hypothetical protein [Clostridium sporogenes]